MRTLIHVVRVFDGQEFMAEDQDVRFDESGILSVSPAEASGARVQDSDETVVDGRGRTLFPGLIDDHVHFERASELDDLARWGVTPGPDMAIFSMDLLEALRQADHGADLRSAGVPIVSPHGAHAKIPGFPRESITEDPDRARELVRERVRQGCDYIKVVLEAPGRGGLEPEVLEAVVEEARAADRLVVAHAVSVGAFRTGIEAGVDVLTHAPLDAVLPRDLARSMKKQGILASPTLTMMRGTAEHYAALGLDVENAIGSLRVMHEEGVEIMAGTDANMAAGVPSNVEHGVSLHEELQLMARAGLDTETVLAAATSGNARAFGLEDRGAVEAGRRADLLLVDGDPSRQLADTRRVVSVWVSGRQVPLGQS